VEDEAPDWVRDGIRQLVDEVRMFLRTAIGFTLRPWQFAAEWSLGRRRALNPLGFLATAFAVAGSAAALFSHLLHLEDGTRSLMNDFLGALTPFAYYLALGALSHLVLSAFGSRRRLRDSCALALYAGGGPALAAQLLVMLLLFLVYRSTGEVGVVSLHSRWGVAMAAGAALCFSSFSATVAISLAGLHARDGIRPWHVLVSNLVAFGVTGFAFAVLQPPGNFGLHLVLGPSHTARGWHFRYGLEI
jgi:hypothetical protein